MSRERQELAVGRQDSPTLCCILQQRCCRLPAFLRRPPPVFGRELGGRLSPPLSPPPLPSAMFLFLMRGLDTTRALCGTWAARGGASTRACQHLSAACRVPCRIRFGLSGLSVLRRRLQGL